MKSWLLSAIFHFPQRIANLRAQGVAGCARISDHDWRIALAIAVSISTSPSSAWVEPDANP